MKTLLTLFVLFICYAQANAQCVANAGTISAYKDTICKNSITGLAAMGATGNLQWQMKDSLSGVFIDIPGAGDDSIITGVLIRQTSYRLIAFSDTCIDTSNIVIINLFRELPVSFITYSINDVNEVQFYADSVVSSLNYVWDFGNGAISTELNPFHVFNIVPGNPVYQVCLVLNNGKECFTTQCVDINIYPDNGCFAYFKLRRDSNITNALYFEDWSILDNSFSNRKIQWGDGSSECCSTPHIYTEAGNYKICIIYSDAFYSRGRSCEFCRFTGELNKGDKIIYGRPNSVEDKLNKMICNVYPNPISSTAIIELKNIPSSNNTFRLYNIYGQEVMAKQLTKPETEITKGNLPAGIYLYKISGENFNTTGKLVIE